MEQKRIDVLDKGYIKLIDFYGSDEAIVEAARVSYEGSKTFRDNERLIRYLMQHKHSTPFEMVDLKFEVKCPLFVAREWFRHRTFSYNEISGRYSILPDDFYIPDKSRIKLQSETNKQGSDFNSKVSDEVVSDMIFKYKDSQEQLYSEYLLFAENHGIARELSRINLPLSIYTKFYFKTNLHNLFHFIKLRSSDKAQWEIREYAKAISSIVEPIVPIAYKAFKDYNVDSVNISGPAISIISKFFDIEKLLKEAEKHAKTDDIDAFKTTLLSLIPKQF